MNEVRIINLTQHQPSQPQIEAGVFNPSPDVQTKVKRLITFESLPTQEEMTQRAQALADLCPVNFAMIGGAPFFQSTLERVLLDNGITPCHAFTLRESVEVNGVKKSVFNHKGFVFNGPEMVKVQ